MQAKRPIVALCYDFDGTLAPGNMQEYGFFSGLGDIAKTFWREATILARENAADPILENASVFAQVLRRRIKPLWRLSF